MSRVDVIIPCYRYGHYLRDCVESVLGQPGVDVRALILDDASPDNTPEVAGDLVRRDSRVEYRRHEVNQRHISTYNEGLEWASGDYALLLSADDLLVPGALRRAVRVLDAHPEVVLVHGRQVQFSTQPGPAETPADLADPPRTILPGEVFVESCCADAHNPVATPTAIVRTSLQHVVGGYRQTLPHTADLEMWLRFAARGAVAWIDAHQAYKRMHASNMQHQYAQPLVELRQRQEAFDSFFTENGDRLKGSQRLQERVTRSLAWQGLWAASRSFDDEDEITCQECMDYARQLWPGLTLQREWTRLCWKRRLGTRVWKALRPLVNRLRGNKRVIAQPGLDRQPGFSAEPLRTCP